MGVALDGGRVSNESIGFLGITASPWHVKGRKSRGLPADFVRDGAVLYPSESLISILKTYPGTGRGREEVY